MLVSRFLLSLPRIALCTSSISFVNNCRIRGQQQQQPLQHLKMSSDAGGGQRQSADAKEDTTREKCLFCRIVDEKSDDLTTLIYKDDEIVAFPDIHPAAKYHFLIVPRKHISDAKVLKSDQIGLLDRLVEVGNKLVDEKVKADLAINDKAGAGNTDIKILRGFHWPPFHSISHLHLHVIAPSDSLGFMSRTIFRPNSWWFVTPEYVRDRLLKEQSSTFSPVDPSKSGDKPVC